MPVGWVKKKVIVRNIINEMIKAWYSKMAEVSAIYYETSTKERCLPEAGTEQESSKDWQSKQDMTGFMNNS
jgi:predicted anti-sigma-YlaC factor YlaD